jgi:hypothetical protein
MTMTLMTTMKALLLLLFVGDGESMAVDEEEEVRRTVVP